MRFLLERKHFEFAKVFFWNVGNFLSVSVFVQKINLVKVIRMLHNREYAFNFWSKMCYVFENLEIIFSFSISKISLKLFNSSESDEPLWHMFFFNTLCALQKSLKVFRRN